MHTTSVSLLERLRRPDHSAWSRFVELYTPLLFHWARGFGLRDQDAADTIQEVFTSLLVKLPEFRYDRDRSFRGWLRTVLRNKWREVLRQRHPIPVDVHDTPLADLADSSTTDPFGEAEYRERLVRRALELIQRDFQPVTWQAWHEFAILGRPAIEVARELGVTPHAVYLAKARVLRRLREELDGLLDE